MCCKWVQALGDGQYAAEEVDVAGLTAAERQKLVERVLETTDQDNEELLVKLRERFDAVDMKFPTVEVKFENVKVDASVYLGRRALPTLPNFTQNCLEVGNFDQCACCHCLAALYNPNQQIE
eukprot:jgi/Mesen1/11005/ME000098S10401